MSHRRKRRPGRHEPEPRRPLDGIRRHPRAAVAAAVLVALVVLAGVLAVTTPKPREFYVQCFDSSRSIAYHIHFWLYIQLGEREPGSLASDFIRVPENMGVKTACMWPVHTHGDTAGERGGYYTKVHVESPYQYGYTLGDAFYVWGKWLGYPRGVYFAADGTSYYRSADVELLVHRGPTIDPYLNVYSSTVRSYAYGAYVPADGDYVEVIVHTPYETLADPY